MKNYLLDTHILLWWLTNDKRLTTQAKSIIADGDNTIFLSAVSVWEIVIKKSLKKLTAPDNLKEILEDNNITILPMTEDHALLLENLPLIHQDPFDRLLIAQCMVENLVFITADTTIPLYGLDCL